MNHHLLFDKYMVVSVLGAGTTGKVYLVKHQKLKVYRAMKKVQKAQSDMPLFQQEISFLKNLNHPGIPVLFDYEEDMDFFYLFEEYVDGVSMDEFVKQNKNLTETLLFQIGLQLCDILSYLHSQKPHPILYQDFKPEHIYLTNGQIKLIDFGLAMFWDEQEKKNKNFYGTSEFSAPEKIQSGEVGISTDVYGLGKVLWVLYQALSQENQNEKLKEIILKAAHQDKMQRFCSMQEFKNALKEAFDSTFEMNTLIKKTNEKHLEKKIAVGASQSRMGATHLSIALCSYLKNHAIRVQYQDMQKDMLQESFLEVKYEQRRIDQKKKSVWRNFLQKTKENTKEESMVVMDYGYGLQDITEFLQADVCLILLGTRPWEVEYTFKLYEKLQYAKNVIFICNWGDVFAAKQIGRQLGKKVYCFPLDEDPYKDSSKKDAFFSYLQQKEGW